MCAIVGWAGQAKRGQWRQVHRLLSELLVVSAVRGTDATGFAALDSRDGFTFDKRPVPSHTFVTSSPSWDRLLYPSCLIAHCRAATHGAPDTGDNRNNHPFVARHFAVVVNGVSPNYANVAAVNGLPLNSECDSEVVLRMIEAHGAAAAGLEDCLDQLTGGMAAAVLDVRRRIVAVVRNELRPAWMLRLAGVRGHLICSTREIAEESLCCTFGQSWRHTVEMLVPLASDAVVEMSASGKLIAARPTSFPIHVGRNQR